MNMDRPELHVVYMWLDCLKLRRSWLTRMKLVLGTQDTKLRGAPTYSMTSEPHLVYGRTSFKDGGRPMQSTA